VVITSRFGERIDPVDPTISKVHRGVDVRCEEGTPVFAAASGEVISAKRNKRGGLTVRLAHDGGVFTLYAHLKEASIAAGDLVEEGQRIGLSGSTGRVTGPHLHFELWKKGQARNPLAYRWRQPGEKVAQGEALTGALATVTSPGL
jgi:murein DD-endopeptidase